MTIVVRPRPSGPQFFSAPLAELARALVMLRRGSNRAVRWDGNRREPYRVARAVGVRITTRKENGYLLVWRV